MLLYLVRHGEAKRENEDPAQGLTQKGRADVLRVAQFLQNKNFSLSRVLHSSKTRARETAVIFADHLKPVYGVSEAENLAPLDNPEMWANRIAGMNEDTMLVGHLPFMARLAGLLLCGDKEKSPIDIKPGGIVCLTRSDDRRWSLEWMIAPEITE
ncbi:MAG TPA: phosphohistidine phosphatase SixA [Nitrospirota bacterium]|nr:phosphohistidine phosphatase SixA [Nitrospirota bacterium]